MKKIHKKIGEIEFEILAEDGDLLCYSVEREERKRWVVIDLGWDDAFEDFDSESEALNRFEEIKENG